MYLWPCCGGSEFGTIHINPDHISSQTSHEHRKKGTELLNTVAKTGLIIIIIIMQPNLGKKYSKEYAICSNTPFNIMLASVHCIMLSLVVGVFDN